MIRAISRFTLAALVCSSLSSCKEKKAAPNAVTPAGSNTPVAGKLDANPPTSTVKSAPITITPPDTSAPTGPATELQAALAAWEKGPQNAGEAVKNLIAWANARGALPAPPARPIDAVPARFALWKMSSALLESRAENLELVEATLYLGQRLRREGSSLMDVTLGGQLAERVAGAVAQPPAFAPKYAPADDEVFRAYQVEAEHAKRTTDWLLTAEGQAEIAKQKAEAAAGKQAMTMPAAEDLTAATAFFTSLTANMPKEKAAFVAHLTKVAEGAKASPSKMLQDMARVFPSHAERLFGYVTSYQAWMRGELIPTKTDGGAAGGTTTAPSGAAPHSSNPHGAAPTAPGSGASGAPTPGTPAPAPTPNGTATPAMPASAPTGAAPAHP